MEQKFNPLTKVYPNLPEDSVLVIDKASYHNRLTEESKSPTTSWRREKVVDWLRTRGKTDDEMNKLTVPQLLQEAKKHHVEKEYKVDKILAPKGIKVLRLPTKHCEYNPIELVWAKVKRYVADNNTTSRNANAMIGLIHEAFRTVTPDFCRKVVEHCKEVMDGAMDAEKLIDVKIRPLIIDLADDDEDQDFEDDVQFTPVDKGVNEEYSLEDPEIQAKEQECLEKIMLESAACYNVTSVLKGITKCQCGASRKKKAPAETVEVKQGGSNGQTCRSCSCTKAHRVCSELCACSPDTCSNRTRATPSISRDDSYEEDDVEAFMDLELESELPRDDSKTSELHEHIVRQNKERAQHTEQMLRLYKEVQSLKEQDKRKISQLSKEEIMELNKIRADHERPVHRVQFMSERFQNLHTTNGSFPIPQLNSAGTQIRLQRQQTLIPKPQSLPILLPKPLSQAEPQTSSQRHPVQHHLTKLPSLEHILDAVQSQRLQRCHSPPQSRPITVSLTDLQHAVHPASRSARLISKQHRKSETEKSITLTEEVSKDDAVGDELDSFLPLTQQMMNEVKNALFGGLEQKTLVDGFDITLSRKDIQTLGDMAWLNDEVVNFYFSLIMDRSKKCAPTVHIFNTFFYPRLLQVGHQGLAQWTRRVDLFALDMIIIPIHLGMHWCLAVADIRAKTITYYDSLLRDNHQCITALRDYIAAEYLAKKNSPIDIQNWKLIIEKDIPEQLNSCDCGVFMCKYADYVSQDKAFDFDQGNMSYFRRRMVWEIINKTLLDS